MAHAAPILGKPSCKGLQHAQVIVFCLLICLSFTPAAGIAYDAAGKRLFVTGKYWPRIFQITPKPLDASSAQNQQLLKTCYT